jgi:hypothetical protein
VGKPLDCEKPIHQAHFKPAPGPARGPLPSSLWENSMHRIGKYCIGQAPVAKSTFTASAALLFASALTLLLPSEASAQFGNIDGLIRGALGNRGYGYRSPHHSSSSHSSKSDKDNSDDDAANHKDGKGIKSSNGDNSGGNGSKGSGDSQSAASNTPPPSKGGSGGGSSGGSAPSKPSDDMPAFQPSR